jgi:hypothetical protein
MKSLHMCLGCVKVKELERDRSVLDKGAYLMNYKGCAECGSATRLESADVVRSESETAERVHYTHRCACGHVVAEHRYTFAATDTLHVYTMECSLCGLGEDEKEWR